MHQPETSKRASAPGDMPQVAAALIERLRTRTPRVHCITNAVAQNFTANVLLAIGAIPSMTLSPEEIGPFVTGADTLLVNLGTFDRERREAAGIAIEAAGRNGVPWVLDPVFVERSAARAEFARALVERGPAALRLNAAEFSALAGIAATHGSVAAYARDNKTAIGLSGETDWVADGERFAAIANGHALMMRVTAMGCAASALVAACLAIEMDAWAATAAALVMFGIAGEIAAETAAGPASFSVAFVDALFSLDGPTLLARAKAQGAFSPIEPIQRA